ncbi:pyridine nucleotide-disulfide oxidoreductase family [Methylobacterium sp. 4-46]|uniref:FAD/NAD(P)-binding protein n=1 Tax=unclassified Methylobacterium TaxID=2615210 RepID=UPI000152D4E9|nr:MULTISPECIES: FAD/NAD(P)-binding protein [Methylobacterium]ACA20887.1 pyridine nucleotide-disulfide oxidoreductase family [Methylobacterium sp. 4-46]WFT80041.1 FAD/NAD(P)-binding protein [Methylobacterium nodulans]
MPQLPVAVIGAGFSGTMAALHLSRLLPPGRQVLLCEQSAVFARGLAYATGCPDHLLNVRAANMSAFPDAPEDFSRWLERCGLDDLACIRATPAGVFAARGLYGRYLTELLVGALTGEASPRLLLENDAVVDLAPAPEGFRLTLAAGRVRAVSGVILACGKLRGGRDWTTRYRLDPWDEAPLDGLRADMPVLVVGTGLTMVDAVAALRRRGFPGPVLALSRHGYLPQVHAPAAPWPAPALSEAERLSARLLLRRLRAEAARAAAAGSDWRGVIDGLRAGSVALWRGLPEAEQRRFLRHLRSVWDVHRHRMAPPAAEIIAREREAGGLSILRGRVEAVADQAGFALVRIRERGAPTPRDLAVQRILDASGVASVARSDDPLLRRLMQRGVVRPDAHGLGLAAAEDLALIGADGTAGRPLWTLGPLLRGTLWECTAVPDIRGQAAALAATVAARLAAEAAHEKPLARAGEG